ncbi:MAG: MarR family winged helix-turn-helix transcriptional regulator [Frankia sp.]
MVEPAATEAWRAIQALMLTGEAHNRLHEVCQRVDLTPAAMKILLVLSAGPRPMRDLVGTFRCDPSYITNIIDVLERRGVARREPHPTDRRAKTVAVTDEGREVVVRAQEMMSVPPSSFAVLTDAEQRQLLDLLTRVTDAEPGIPAVMRPRPAAESTAG